MWKNSRVAFYVAFLILGQELSCNKIASQLTFLKKTYFVQMRHSKEYHRFTNIFCKFHLSSVLKIRDTDLKEKTVEDLFEINISDFISANPSWHMLASIASIFWLKALGAIASIALHLKSKQCWICILYSDLIFTKIN